MNINIKKTARSFSKKVGKEPKGYLKKLKEGKKKPAGMKPSDNLYKKK